MARWVFFEMEKFSKEQPLLQNLLQLLHQKVLIVLLVVVILLLLSTNSDLPIK